MNKKGGITDLFIFLIAIFSFVAIIGILMAVFSQTNEKLMEQAPSLQKSVPVTLMNVSVLMENTIGKSIASYDVLSWITILIFFGMILNILISSALIKTNPFWIMGYVFVTAIAVIVSAQISNIYETIYQLPQISEGFADLMSMSWLMLQLPVIITVVGLLAGLLLFINIDWGNS